MYLGSLFKNFQYCLNKMSPGAQTPPIWTVLADGNWTQIWKIATKFLHVSVAVVILSGAYSITRFSHGSPVFLIFVNSTT